MADGAIESEGGRQAEELKNDERMEEDGKEQELQGASFVLFYRQLCLLRMWCCMLVCFMPLVSSMNHSPKPPGLWPGRNPRLTEHNASVPVGESPSSRKGTSRTSFVMSICCSKSVCLLCLAFSLHISLELFEVWYKSKARQLGHTVPAPVVYSKSPRNRTSPTSFMKQWVSVRSNKRLLIYHTYHKMLYNV